MEKCVFCGWTRRTAYPSIRFFDIPKEPGLKRIQWLYVLGDREVGPKDRVCSVHFRQGRPSSDPIHEDFVPHLYLNQEPSLEIISYLESLADTKNGDGTPSSKLSKPPESSTTPHSFDLSGKKPSILKRKRKVAPISDPAEVDTKGIETKPRITKLTDQSDESEPRRVKLHVLQQIAEDKLVLSIPPNSRWKLRAEPAGVPFQLPDNETYVVPGWLLAKAMVKKKLVYPQHVEKMINMIKPRDENFNQNFGRVAKAKVVYESDRTIF